MFQTACVRWCVEVQAAAALIGPVLSAAMASVTAASHSERLSEAFGTAATLTRYIPGHSQPWLFAASASPSHRCLTHASKLDCLTCSQLALRLAAIPQKCKSS
jgi:hypothetical protein